MNADICCDSVGARGGHRILLVRLCERDQRSWQHKCIGTTRCFNFPQKVLVSYTLEAQLRLLSRSVIDNHREHDCFIVVAAYCYAGVRVNRQRGNGVFAWGQELASSDELKWNCCANFGTLSVSLCARAKQACQSKYNSQIILIHKFSFFEVCS